MTSIATYSPEDVDVIVAGVVKITGMVDGTFISISKDFNSFTTSESSDGHITRSHSGSELYTLTLTLASTSDSNQHLTFLHNVDNNSLMGKFPLIMKDQRGQTLLFASSCWIETIPDTDFGASIGQRQWSIKCAGSVLNVGGNYKESKIGDDILNLGLGLAGGLLP